MLFQIADKDTTGGTPFINYVIIAAGAVAFYAIGCRAAPQIFRYLSLEARENAGFAWAAHLLGLGIGLAAGAAAAVLLRSGRREQTPIRRTPTGLAGDFQNGQREFDSVDSRPRGPQPLVSGYVADAQQEFVKLLADGKEKEALERYLAFIRRFRHASLPATEQIRVADLFLVREEYRTAQEAYERFLRHYPESEHARDVRYNLAMLCAEYTQDFTTARRLLKELIRTTGDSGKLVHIEEELKRVEDHYAKIHAGPEEDEEPGEAKAGKFALFRQSGGRINIPEVGRLIAAMLKLPLADVTTRLFACSGFLADSLGRRQAESLARDLQQMNIPVLLIEQDRVRRIPEAVLAEDASFDDEGLSTTVGGQSDKAPWDSILMVNAGVLENTRTREVSKDKESDVMPRSALGFGPRRRKSELIRDTQQRTVIDVLVEEPWQRYRIQEGLTRFSLMGERRRPTNRENLELLAQEVLRHADATFVGDAVSALARHAGMSEFVYDNRRKYDLVNFWLAHRALYDRPS